MKKRYILLIIIISFILIPKFGVAFNEKKDIIIKYKDSKDASYVAKKYGASKDQVQVIESLNLAKIKDANFWQNLKIKSNQIFSNDIEKIESDSKYTILLTPNDPMYQSQWALEKLQANSAWEVSTGNTIKIAIVDTGVNANHEDLSGKVLEGYNILSNSVISENSNSDDHGHGTSVAGAASAVANNQKGIASLNWNAKIIPVKVLDSSGSGYSFDIAKGIIYAADHGAKVINLSLGGGVFSDTLRSAIDYAYDAKNALVIAATGNSNTVVSYPAAYDKVFSVGASDQSDNRWYKSNYGKEIDVLAPGSYVISTNKSGAYGNVTGTSIATPYVSGLAALIWSMNSSFNNEKIATIIRNSTDKIPAMGGKDFDNCCGYGRINAYKALTSNGSYEAEIISQNASPTIVQGRSYNFVVKIKNTGGIVWKKSVVRLGTNNPLDRTPYFSLEDSVNQNKSNWISSNRIEMQEESIGPGQIATFSFWMSVPGNLKEGNYNENFRLVADGLEWIDNTDISWNVNVISRASAFYPNQWISQNAYPTLRPNESYNFYLKIKNTGSEIWQKSIVHLATDRKQDRETVFLRNDVMNVSNNSNWVSANRIEMLEEKVNPGEIATFSFWMSIPANIEEKNYKEYFRLVADGITWMEDHGIYWEIKVVKPHAKWSSQSEYPVLKPGETKKVWIEYENNGETDWLKYSSNPIRLGTDRPGDRTSLFASDNWISSNRIEIDKERVTPGQIGKFEFDIKVPENTPKGTYREYFKPVSEGLIWLEDYGVYFDVTVY